METIDTQNFGNSQDSLVYDYPLTDKVLRRIARGLAETLGRSCEVVVHDLHDPASSVVHVENGQVTDRRVGDGIRDIAAILRSDRFSDDMLSNYVTRTPDGKVCKSMTLVVRNEREKIIGAFALNLDISEFLSAKGSIEDFIKGRAYAVGVSR